MSKRNAKPRTQALRWMQNIVTDRAERADRDGKAGDRGRDERPHFYLEGLRLLSPNRVRGLTRGAALGHAAKKKLMRTRAGLASMPITTPIRWRLQEGSNSRIEVEIVRRAPRMFDDDNLVASAKAVRDGIADALGVADDHPQLSFRYRQELTRQGVYGVMVYIEVQPQ